MEQILDAISGSAWSSIGSLVGFLTLFLTLDQIAGDRRATESEFRSLVRVTMLHRCRALLKFINEWRVLDNYDDPECPAFIREYLLRLDEIEEHKSDVSSRLRRYQRENWSLNLVGALGVCAALISLYPPWRLYGAGIAICLLLLGVVLAFDLRRRAQSVGTLQSRAFFRDEA